MKPRHCAATCGSLVLLLAVSVLVSGCGNRVARGDGSDKSREQSTGQTTGVAVEAAVQLHDVSDSTSSQKHNPSEEPSFDNKPLSQWIAQLASEKAQERKEALRAISAIGPRAQSALPAVQKLLHDPDPDVQEWACSTLGRIGPAAKVAVAELEKIVSNSQAQDKVRWAAAIALGNIGPDAVAATPTLLKALENSDPWLRWAATEGLAGIGPKAPGAAAALAKALNDQEYIVRIGAARALVHLAQQIPPKGEPLASLVRCYEDASQYDSVRQKVAEAIKAVDQQLAAKLGIK